MDGEEQLGQGGFLAVLVVFSERPRSGQMLPPRSLQPCAVPLRRRTAGEWPEFGVVSWLAGLKAPLPSVAGRSGCLGDCLSEGRLSRFVEGFAARVTDREQVTCFWACGSNLRR